MKNQNEQVRQRIKDSFIREYSQTPIHKISVKKLCEESGIARTSFYTYYSDVYEVLEEVEDEIIDFLFNANSDFLHIDFKKYYSNTTYAYFDRTLSYIQERQQYFKALLGKNTDNQFVHKWKKIMKQHFRERYEQEQIPLANQGLVLEMIASALIGSYTYWLFHMDQITREDVAKEVLDKLCQDFLR